MILREYQVWELYYVGAKATELCMEHRYGITSSKTPILSSSVKMTRQVCDSGFRKACGPDAYIYRVLSMCPQTF